MGLSFLLLARGTGPSVRVVLVDVAGVVGGGGLGGGGGVLGDFLGEVGGGGFFRGVDGHGGGWEDLGSIE